MSTKKNAINWFEIHAADFERAKRFYETILQTQLQNVPVENCPESQANKVTGMAVFPYDQANGVGGAITKMEGCNPGVGGTIVFLNVEGDLQGVLDRIPGAGGTIIKPYTAIGEHGFIGIIKDTEGNCVGLHSYK